MVMSVMSDWKHEPWKYVGKDARTAAKQNAVGLGDLVHAAGSKVIGQLEARVCAPEPEWTKSSCKTMETIEPW